MSKIGKNPIIVPENIKIELNNNYIVVIGKLGVLIKKIPNDIDIKLNNNKLYITSNSNTKIAYSNWGTLRVNVKNMITGVTQGFFIKLKVIGVGYRAYVENKYLKLKVGFSHIIKIPIIRKIKVKCIKNTKIYIYGIDLQKVTQIASKIRSYKKPDPYKGKGIRYEDEIVLLKEGKKK
jgi:large subunit ribosomal protein L6